MASRSRDSQFLSSKNIWRCTCGRSWRIWMHGASSAAHNASGLHGSPCCNEAETRCAWGAVAPPY
eukprot:8822463-Pyramimonas_sp.AAC.1